MAASVAASEAVHLKGFLTELGLHNEDEPISLGVDNTGARDIAYNPEHHQKVKHIARRHFFVRECVENGEIVVPYVNTSDNEADFFTKPLEGKLFFELRDRIMNVAPTALGGLARSYRASVHGGVLSAVRARACAVRSRVSNAVSYLGMYAERGL